MGVYICAEPAPLAVADQLSGRASGPRGAGPKPRWPEPQVACGASGMNHVDLLGICFSPAHGQNLEPGQQKDPSCNQVKKRSRTLRQCCTYTAMC